VDVSLRPIVKTNDKFEIHLQRYRRAAQRNCVLNLTN
jgi:hypothetical protein